MAIEVIPEKFKEPFDPFGYVDHALVALYTKTRLMSGDKGVRSELQRAYNFNRLISRPLVQRLIDYGKFLEPVNDDLEAKDSEFGRVRAFNSGAALALVAIANLAFELDVNQFEWRQRWIDLPKGIEAPSSIKVHNDMTADDCYRIGSALMELGHRNLRQLEAPYQHLADEISAVDHLDGSQANTLQAAFGYTVGVGRRVVRDIVYERAVDEVVFTILPGFDSPHIPDELDHEYEALVSQEIRKDSH